MNGKIKLGEWLPDQPFYDNPGLTEAKNCIPTETGYGQFLGLSTRSEVLSGTILGAASAIGASGTPEVYAGTTSELRQLQGTSWTNRSGTTYTTPSNGYWRFAQFDERILATNGSQEIQTRTLGSVNNFADLAAAAPVCVQLGTINNFVVAGNCDGTQYKIQWCAIGDPTSWPTPGTTAARTAQAGAENLNAALGAVTAIAGGQFYGLIFQERGITRATYVGGDLVFQFEEIDSSRGCWCPQSMVQIGSRCYFIAADGLYVTDGTSVEPIGYGRFDQWFLSNVDMNYRYRVTGAVDYAKKCIYWSFPSFTANGSPDRMLIYNFQTGKAAWADQACTLIFGSLTLGLTLEQIGALYPDIETVPVSFDSLQWQGGVPLVNAISGGALAAFTGDALDARLETGEAEFGDGGLTYIDGVRPLVTGEPELVSVGIAARTFQDSESRTFSPQVTRTLRTGICDFRTQGRYVSARLDIEGGFDRALALQYNTMPGDGL